tara:strand:- start:1142 stop:1618 length:477 start_codon:yes stop_codon:yes gene_type:complete
MPGFINTFQLIQDKLADIIRTEFNGLSVYFDDEYLNRKTKYFNIKKGSDSIITNLVPSSQLRNYSTEVKYYSKKSNFNDQQNLKNSYFVGDRVAQLIKNNQNVDFHTLTVDGSTRTLNFIDAVFSNYNPDPDRDDSEDFEDLEILSFDFNVNVFESMA